MNNRSGHCLVLKILTIGRAVRNADSVHLHDFVQLLSVENEGLALLDTVHVLDELIIAAGLDTGLDGFRNLEVGLGIALFSSAFVSMIQIGETCFARVRAFI